MNGANCDITVKIYNDEKKEQYFYINSSKSILPWTINVTQIQVHAEFMSLNKHIVHISFNYYTLVDMLHNYAIQWYTCIVQTYNNPQNCLKIYL